ncbi:MAG: hypothetical protein ACI9H8_002292 [Lysobacterales bacterium]
MGTKRESASQQGELNQVHKMAWWKAYIYDLIGAEISSTSRYYDNLAQYLPMKHDDGYLLEKIDSPQKVRVENPDHLPDFSQDLSKRSMLLLNGNFNYSSNLQELLAELKPKLSRTSRLAVVAYNPYLSWLYRLANFMRVRKAELPKIFLSTTDLDNLCKLSGFEVVRLRLVGYFPFRILGLGTLINRIMPVVPILRWIGYACIVILRPVIPESAKPSLTIVIPARNERGNIEDALRRIPGLDGARTEVVFVEGHSIDGTWEEIQRVLPLYRDRFQLSAYRQTGKGKNDAVRLGFSKASCDLVTILDADLTVPPERLELFYRGYCDGLGDFVNGNRLVYRMEGEAMRFLNTLGNVFFAKSLKHVLGLKIGDALCGTKLFPRHDYSRIVAWRKDFGDFDPFGDFEMLFSVSELSLGVIDVPIPYGARTYGSTNISRFRDGLQLLRMTFIGLFRIRLGKAP